MVFLFSVKDAKNQGYLIEKQISSTNAVNTLKIFSECIVTETYVLLLPPITRVF